MKAMPKFRHSEEVSALRIKEVKPVASNAAFNEIHFTEAGHAPIQVANSWVTEHNPQPGGWFIVDSKGNRRAMDNASFAAKYQNRGVAA